MKGWQNQLVIIQKVRRNDEQVKKIQSFENNEYLTEQTNDHIKYKFPQSACFSIKQLIESIKYKFIKIYKGQLLIIVQQMLEHLLKLHQNIQISHGNLIPQNIIIKLKLDKNNNNLTILQTKFTIQEMYFVNYRLIEDINYQINFFQDVDDIIDCSIALIEAFSNLKCQLLLLMVNAMKDFQKNKQADVLNRLADLIQYQIQQCVDKESQKVKKKEIQQIINLNQDRPITIKCEEDEEYGILSKRYRLESLIIDFIQEILSQDLINQLIDIKTKNYQLNKSISIFDVNKLKGQDELKVFEIFTQLIQQKMMKIIWEKFGTFLESWDQDAETQQREILKIINKNNQEILNIHFSYVLQEFNNVQQINNEIKEEIEKNYKFDIEYNEQIAKDRFILELRIQVQNYDFQDIQILINKVKSNVKSELQEYYNDVLMMEILNLQNYQI